MVLGVNTQESNVKYFAINESDSLLYDLCDCGDFDAAEESAKDLGIKPVWIITEAEAYQWSGLITRSLNQYENRVRELESEGMTRSDAQAVADAEVQCNACGAECSSEELDSWGVCLTCCSKGFGND